MAHIFHSINPNHILEHVCMSNLHQARIIQTHTDYTETCPFVVSSHINTVTSKLKQIIITFNHAQCDTCTISRMHFIKFQFF